MISKKIIKEALDYGNENFYEIFGEIRHKENIGNEKEMIFKIKIEE